MKTAMTTVPREKTGAFLLPWFLWFMVGIIVLPLTGSVALSGETGRAAAVPGLARNLGNAPSGARMGSFFLYPSITLETVHDDNIFAAASGQTSGKTGDSIVRTTAGATVLSSWSRHALGLNASVKNVSYRNHSNENHTDFRGGASWRLDVSNGIAMSGTVFAGRRHEDRGAGESPLSAARPVVHDGYGGTVMLDKHSGRWAVRLGGTVEVLDYSDVKAVGGGMLDQDSRDTVTYTALLRNAYQFAPGKHVFGQLETNLKDNSGSAGTANGSPGHSSTGYGAHAGFSLEIPEIVTGEISVGYLGQDHRSSLFGDVHGLAAKGHLVWHPTRLLTVTLEGERGLSATTYNNSAVRQGSMVSGQVRYEVWRNLVVSPHISWRTEDYLGDIREDRTVETGLRLDYIAGRNMVARGFYKYTSRNSTTGTHSYDRRVGGIGLELKF